jgi:VCBS repeat protein
MGRWLTVCVAVSAVLPGCYLRVGPDWDTTRKAVVEPLNSALHRTLPRSIRQRDLTAILGLYATETGTGLSWATADAIGGEGEDVLRWHGPPASETIRARYEYLLSLFENVESAELRIDTLDWDHPSPQGYRASVHLVVRGEAGPIRRQLDQRAVVYVSNTSGSWKITAEEVTARELASGARPRYAVATQASGIDDVHETNGSPSFRIIGGIFNSSGSAVGDIDGDGFEDIVLASASHLTVYHNNRNGTFSDATDRSGLPSPFPSVATGVVLFDYDNDGYPDLFVAAVTGGDRLFHNIGGGTFADVTAAAGIKAGNWSSMPTVADYDRDGFLDIYVVRMGDHEHTPPNPNYEAHNGFPNILYHNNGDGTFTDVTQRAGVGDTGWGLAGAWADYDEDGWPDLYVVNEFGSNTLYHNQHDGTFRDVTQQSGTADRGAGMGVAWGDYDNDGHLDLFISNMHANSRWLLFNPSFPEPIPWYLKVLGWFTPEVRRRVLHYTDELTRGSTLLHNNGDGTFTDVSDAAGVRDTQWGWGVAFVDYNNDGWLDLYALNGFLSNTLLDDV